MARHLTRGRVFRDPVHDIIFIPATNLVILELLETPAVQRLRRIRQLGLAHLVFPGAEHSRFIHSLGVQHLAGRILTRIREQGEGDPEVVATLERTTEVLAAALLHDIGHGPFSHTFENVLARRLGSHEAWSRRIIQDSDNEVRRVLEHHGLDVDFVTDLIEGKAEDLLAQDIVSSQLDADRMDYLLRDSLMTGVAYGKIDLEWILNVMRPGRAPDGRVRLGVDGVKGLHAVESYLFARRSIHLQVYHHRTVRAFEAMLANLLCMGQAFLQSGNTLPPGTPASICCLLGDDPIDTRTFLAIDDSDIHMMLKAWGTEMGKSRNRGLAFELGRLSQALLRRDCLYSHIDLSHRPRVAATVAAQVQAMVDRGDEASFHVQFDDWISTLYQSAQAALEGGQKRQDAFAQVIPIVGKDNTVRPLEQDAPWLDIMQDFPGRQARVYYDPEWEDQLAEVLETAREK